MNLPYTIQDGEIKEHKLSFEMQLNAINNRDVKRESISITKVPDVFKSCSCGSVFVQIGTVDICDECFDKFDNMKHFLNCKKRNK